MHRDELGSDEALVRRLIGAQFPEWADLRIADVGSLGTENTLYRLGAERVVRLPRCPGLDEQAEKLHRWLPALGPRLPLAIPRPIAQGEPSSDFPARWSIYAWIEGEVASAERIASLPQAARELGCFVAALQRIDSAAGPPPGEHNFFRGVPLATRDAQVRAALEALRGVIDTDWASAQWNAALRAPAWQGRPVWLHGDLRSENLLVSDGRLRAVIDFGGLGVGDPAPDLIIAWELFSAESRAEFRSALGVDDATWARGRGWALYVALSALAYYTADTNPAMLRFARRLLGELASS
jgi:aminoglycoside phosphotransferase (APT) family kinase protein